MNSKRLNQIKALIAHGRNHEALEECDILAVRIMTLRDNLNLLLADIQGLRQTAERGIKNAQNQTGSEAAEIGRR